MIPETCPKCGAGSNRYHGITKMEGYLCGSMTHPTFSESDLCLARSEIATLRAQLAETSHTDCKSGREFAELQSEIIVLKARLQDVQSHLQSVESDRRGILIRAEMAEAERDEARSKGAAVEEIAALKAEIESCSRTARMMTNLSNDWRIRAEDAQAKIKQLEFYPIIVACDPAHPETYARAVDVVALRERADRMESERDTAHQELATLKAEHEALVTAYNEEMNDASQDVAALRERAIKTEREAQRLWRLLQEATLQGAKETP